MTVFVQETAHPRRKQRRWLAWCGALVLTTFAAIAATGIHGFRVNFTPSEPIGLWRILPLDRPVRNGDLVFICPPITEAMREARARGYLRYGLCTGGVAPMIKTVAATSGQIVDIHHDVRIDGNQLAHSQPMAKDARGRQMVPYRGGVVPSGTLYLHSDFPGSFVSRYFGPLPLENVLGMAREVWTYDP